MLTKVFAEWEIDVEWKKGPNYFKAILPGLSKVSPFDLQAIETILLREEELNRKTIA